MKWILSRVIHQPWLASVRTSPRPQPAVTALILEVQICLVLRWCLALTYKHPAWWSAAVRAADSQPVRPFCHNGLNLNTLEIFTCIRPSGWDQWRRCLPGFALSGGKDVPREYVQSNDAKAIEVFVFKFLSKQIIFNGNVKRVFCCTVLVLLVSCDSRPRPSVFPASPFWIWVLLT